MAAVSTPDATGESGAMPPKYFPRVHVVRLKESSQLERTQRQLKLTEGMLAEKIAELNKVREELRETWEVLFDSIAERVDGAGPA